MEISKQSWHYKAITQPIFWFLSPWDASENLCLYFWQVVLRVLLGMGLGLILTAPVFAGVTLYFDYKPDSVVLTPVLAFQILATGVAILSAALFLVALLVEGLTRLFQKAAPNRVSTAIASGTDFAVQFTKDKLRKRCSRINFKG